MNSNFERYWYWIPVAVIILWYFYHGMKNQVKTQTGPVLVTQPIYGNAGMQTNIYNAMQTYYNRRTGGV